MPTYEQIDWYETPLYYDIVFDTDTAKEADFIDAMVKKYCETRGRGPKRGLEPACGTGRLITALTQRGYDMAGFDANEAMVRFARERFSAERIMADVAVGRMEQFKIRRPFDFAYNLVSTFKYLLTEKDAKSHLECVAEALKPGGIYVLGFHLSQYEDDKQSRERWVGKRGDIGVVCNITGYPPDKKKRKEKVRSRMTITRGEEEKRHEVEWEFRTYDARQFKTLLKKVPTFEMIDVYDFTYNPNESHEFGGENLDQLVILKRS